MRSPWRLELEIDKRRKVGPRHRRHGQEEDDERAPCVGYLPETRRGTSADSLHSSGEPGDYRVEAQCVGDDHHADLVVRGDRSERRDSLEVGIIDQATKIISGVGEIVRPKKYSRKHHAKEGAQHLRCIRNTGEVFGQEEALKGHKTAVPDPPQHEGPFGAVPQTGEEKNDPEVQILAWDAHLATTERVVEILAHPPTEGDMPPAPKVGEARRQVWSIKVLRKAKAEHPGESDRHVRVAGKVVIDLCGVGDDSKPGELGRERLSLEGKDLIGGVPNHVSDEHLFGESNREEGESVKDIVAAERARTELLLDLVVADDRPSDELRKEEDVQ